MIAGICEKVEGGRETSNYLDKLLKENSMRTVCSSPLGWVTRNALDSLCGGVRAHAGNPLEVGKLAVDFVSSVAIGFTATGYKVPTLGKAS